MITDDAIYIEAPLGLEGADSLLCLTAEPAVDRSLVDGGSTQTVLHCAYARPKVTMLQEREPIGVEVLCTRFRRRFGTKLPCSQ